jgi:hypothetical protein
MLLCVLVTFAWINEVQNPKGVWMELTLEDAAIATSELDIRLSVNVEEESTDQVEKYTEFTKLYNEELDLHENLEDFANFAPGSRKKFQVEITNKSTSPVRLSMVLSKILCENEELAKHVIVGTNGFRGFTAAYPEPAVQTMLLSEGMDNSGALTLVDFVEIPPKAAGSEGYTVTVYFYVMFTASGSADLEDESFSIGKLNFLTV